MRAIYPRPLNPKERALAQFLLSADFPGCDDLRRQLVLAEAVALCECGCGTIRMRVAGKSARATCREPVPIEAHGAGIQVLLFVRRGLLTSLEIVDYGDARPLAYPLPENLNLWLPPMVQID